jgi:hypothetical protein
MELADVVEELRRLENMRFCLAEGVGVMDGSATTDLFEEVPQKLERGFGVIWCFHPKLFWCSNLMWQAGKLLLESTEDMVYAMFL